MNDCQHYQDQMLEHLYGLLEGEENEALLRHLTDCSSCRGALDKARGQQRLLAAAAKGSFPTLQFSPPVDDPASRPILSLLRRGIQPRLIRWAVAAILLLAVGGLAIPGAWYGHDFLQARKTVTHHQEQLAQTEQHLTKVSGELRNLPAEENQKLNRLSQEAQQRQLNVVVSGPERVQVGAPNEFRIRTRNLAGQPVPARLDVRVLDQKGQAVFEQTEVASLGDYQVVLQPNLPLAPDSRLALEVRAHREGDAFGGSQVREQLELASPVYLTHLMTDKPMYQPGETVRFRSLTLERSSLKPAEEEFQLIYTISKPTQEKVEILKGLSRLVKQDEKGSQIDGPDGRTVRGLGVGEYPLDPYAPGGEYTLTVREAQDRFPPQERKFLVNRYQPGQLNKELTFGRSSYGPGETVAIACRATRADGTPVADRPVRANVFLDGRTYGADGKPTLMDILGRTDAQGAVTFTFKLPLGLNRGEGIVRVTFSDGGNIEPIVRPIPIVLKKLQIEFFAEGGDLVTGFPNRVYFRVRTTLDKPADLQGRLVDDRNKIVVPDIRTLNDGGLAKKGPGVNQGLGAFTFTPGMGRTYELKIDTPLGVEGRHFLPPSRPEGVVLKVPKVVTGPGDSLDVQVYSAGADRSLLIGAYCRGRLLDHQTMTVKKGQPAQVSLRPAQGMGGVYRITVFEEREVAGSKRRQLVPVAERLVYRQPAERLHLEVRPDKQHYIPGDRVTLSLTARNEEGNPAGAVVALQVVDKRILTLADEKTFRSMPAHFLLTTEIRRPEDLEYADFLLSDNDPARTTLDLLLGTQGWRRFAEQDPARFREKFKEDADRLLVAMGQTSPRETDFALKETQRLQEEIKERRQSLAAEKEGAEAALLAVRGNSEARAAAVTLDQYRAWFDRFHRQGVPILGGLLGLVMIAFLLLRRPRLFSRPMPFIVGTACAVLLVAVALFYPAWLDWSAPWRGVGGERRFALAEKSQAGGEHTDQFWAAARAAPLMKAEGAEPAEVTKAPVAGGMKGALELPGKPARLEGLGGRNKVRMGLGGPMIMMAKPAGLGGGPKDLRRIGGGGMVPRMADRPAGELAGPPIMPMAPALRPPLAMEKLRAPEEELPPVPLVVREYAHQRRPVDNLEVRTDFTETLFWNPVLVIPSGGKTDVSFDLCDSVTAFAITASGHTLDGRLGSLSSQVEARLPFTLEPKTPLEVTSSDRIDLPVSIANTTPHARTVKLSVTTQGLKLLEGTGEAQLSVAGGQVTRRVFPFRPEGIEGEVRVEIRGSAEPLVADAIARTFRIVPDGFPVVGSKSDLLEGVARAEVLLPETWVKGTLKCQVQVFPSTLAALEKGLEGLLREPSGCFEQTSTSNYPNVLILDYLKESNQARPETENRARELLARGYDGLVSYECPQSGKPTRQGYEWFGAADNAHEALTAYGLLQFRDMARIHKVDPAMLDRTRKYLLAARDGQGGFKRNPQALDTFGRAPQHITNAYIVWALTESGPDDDVEKELKALTDQARTSKDAYFLALVANSLLNRHQEADGLTLLRTVAGLQKSEGYLDAAETSITGSRGRDLQIETTALAVLGWLKANRPSDFNVNVQKGVKWIGQQRGGFGGFGSTQATILALKALIAFTRANKKTAEAGELSLLVGEQRLGHLKFPAGAQDVLTIDLPEPEKHLKPGKNALRTEISGQNAFPYTLTWTYQTLQPPSAAKCPVRLETKLDRQTAAEGETVHLTASLENLTDKGQGMAVAIIGLPGGLSLPEDLKQLKDHARLRENGKKPGLIGAFETRSRELILYWRDLAPRQKIEVPVDLVCRVPGIYRGPASRAYLYYNADARCWVKPLEAKVTAKGEGLALPVQ